MCLKMNTPKQKKWVNSVFRQISITSSESANKRKLITRHYSEPSLCYSNQESCAGGSITKFSEQSTEKELISHENHLNIFSPRNCDELAIHPKKIKELQQWLQQCHSKRKEHEQSAQLCLLTGPPGCGKSTALHVLAKELGYNIQEWVNPLDQEIVYNLGDQQIPYSDNQTINNTQIDTLKNFLFKASRYKSILESSTRNKCLLVMEDFPNFIIKDQLKFEEILQDYRDYGKSPLIFIVTDSKSRQLNIEYNLFTDHIKGKFSIHHINFNVVATTLMQKAMKRFVSIIEYPELKQIYEIPSDDKLDSIVSLAQGDIRNATINFHYVALKSSQIYNNQPLQFLQKDLKKRRLKKMTSNINTENCKHQHDNTNITAMHALGRVFNPKYTDKENRLFVHNPDIIMETLNHEPKTYIELMQSNYIEHFNNIENIGKAADGLSVTDVILNEYRDNTLANVGLNIAIRNLMVNNKEPASRWLPIKPHKRLPPKTRFILNEQHRRLLPEPHNIPKQLYFTEFITYVNILSQ